MYLYKRGSTFYFQLRRPSDIPASVCGLVIKQSLKTQYRSVAALLASQLRAQWEARFDDFRKGLVSDFKSDLKAAFEYDSIVSPEDVVAAYKATSQEARAALYGLLDGLEQWVKDAMPTRELEAKYRSALRSFSEWLGHPATTHDAAMLLPYREWWLEHRGAPNGWNNLNSQYKKLFALAGVTVDAKLTMEQQKAMRRKAGLPINTEESKQPLDADDIRAIKASKWTYGKPFDPRWVDLLCLMGLRSGEALQITERDIEETPYGLFVSINDVGLTRDGYPKTVKNKTSVRRVPVPAGYSREDVLSFPKVRPTAFQTTFCTKVLLDGKKSLHSTRHTFKTLCRSAGVPKDVHDAITGHAGNVGDGYGGRFDNSLVALREASDKVLAAYKHLCGE